MVFQLGGYRILNSKTAPFNISGMVSSSIISSIESAFNAGTNYSLFSGQTSAAEEAGYIGYKHTTAKRGIVLYMNQYGLQVGIRDTSGNWTFRYVYRI